jgi:hypothetical protein
MKIIEVQSARLTNAEVLERVKEVLAEHDGTDGTKRERPMPKNLEKVLRKVSNRTLHSHHCASAKFRHRRNYIYIVQRSQNLKSIQKM